MQTLLAALIVVAWLTAGVLIDLWVNDKGSAFERGAMVLLGPPLLVAISPFLFLGWLSKQIEKVWPRD